MSEAISRREFAKGAVLAGAALAAPSALAQQASEPPKVPQSDIDRINAMLQKPVAGPAAALLSGAIANNQGNGKQRLKYALPENSEPGFMVVSQPAERKHP